MEQKQREDREQRLNRIKKRYVSRKTMRLQLLAATIGLVVLVVASFAWYTWKSRQVESKTAEVMRPYYLTLLNPGEQNELELAVGNLFPGEKKQVVFCVTNKPNEENIDMGGSDFDYEMELIHTENLNLTYEISQLQKVDTEEGADIITKDTDKDKNVQYWKKQSPVLNNTDVSNDRWTETGVTENTINRGKYLHYEKTYDGQELHLDGTSVSSGFDSNYFVMEIEWKTGSTEDFQKYEKETDMLYLLVKAMQPRPQPQPKVKDQP
ncbi:MAG: hypothetical protein PHE02_06080 [Lachnospiraceae bacterium]|nr:hypothetical protein [Lachnospiraceae bacterium]